MLIKNDELKKLVMDVLTDARHAIVEQMRKNGQYVTGKTAQQIICECEVGTFGAKARITAPISLLTLETGRRPGRVPFNFQQVIFQWSIDKRLQFRTVSARRSFAYYTARKISREGSWIYRQGFRVDVYTTILRTATEKLKEKLKNTALISNEDVLVRMPTTTIKQTL